LNTTIDVLSKRLSLRKYSEIPISKEYEDIIIEGAMRAPTAGNMMLYSIIIVKDKEKKDTLSKTCDNQPFISNSPLVMIFVADYKKLYDYYSLSNAKEFCLSKNVEFIGPTYANLLLGASDALIAAQNAAIAAESLGIGSCYIGDIMENYETHRTLLNLPNYVFPIAMLTFGYYPEGINRTPRSRFDKKYIVFNEEYKNLSNTETMDMYSEWDKRFSETNQYGAQNMGQFHYLMKTRADFSLEMERSVKVAMKYWDGDKL
jgi:FMN reductase (NADPH)